MDTLSFFSLLLLFSLSVADLQNNDIIEIRKAIAEQPQPCPSDLHAVLRDVSAKLASLQTKTEHLEKENGEQAGKLAKNEVEIQKQQTLIQEQAGKLAKNEVEIQKQQTLIQEQASKLSQHDAEIVELRTLHQEQDRKLLELQTKTSEVDPLKEQVRGQTAEINSIKEQNNVTVNHVESLRRDREVGRVAFSASLFDSTSGTIGPFSADTTLVFKHAITNFGKAYNPNTGIFTAPVRGVYHFEYHILTYWQDATRVGLVKNTEQVVVAFEYDPNGRGTTSNGVSLMLEAGDVVFLRLWANYRVEELGNQHNTFSGRLVFPM